MNIYRKKIPIAQRILPPDVDDFCQAALISHVPNQGPFYKAFLRQRREENARCGGIPYLPAQREQGHIDEQ